MTSATYISDNEWIEKRDELAGAALLREAAALITGKPVEREALVDAARDWAGLEMAVMGLLPEGSRDLDAA